MTSIFHSIGEIFQTRPYRHLLHLLNLLHLHLHLLHLLLSSSRSPTGILGWTEHHLILALGTALPLIVVDSKIGFFLFFKNTFNYRPPQNHLSKEDNSTKKVLFFTPSFFNTGWDKIGLHPEKLAQVNGRETNTIPNECNTTRVGNGVFDLNGSFFIYSEK